MSTTFSNVIRMVCCCPVVSSLCRLCTVLEKAPHVSQCRHWDCGVACAQMVLQGLGREVERSSLLASLRTQSVWTIDLAMLLHRQGVRWVVVLTVDIPVEGGGLAARYVLEMRRCVPSCFGCLVSDVNAAGGSETCCCSGCGVCACRVVFFRSARM